MRNRRRRHSSYKFTEKTHSKRGMVATGLAAALLVLYIVFIHFAFRADGKLSMYYGSAGVMAMLVSVITLVIAAGSLRGRLRNAWKKIHLSCSRDLVWDWQ